MKSPALFLIQLLCLSGSANCLIAPSRTNIFGLRIRIITPSYLPRHQYASKGALLSTNDNNINDDELLKNVKLDMLKDIAKQQGLSTNGSKKQILERLRTFVNEQAASNADGEFYYTTSDAINATKEDPAISSINPGNNERPQNMPLASDAYVNEDGERVVTVFSTKEEVDLTKAGPHTRPGGMDAAAASFADATANEGSGGLSAADTLRSTESMEQDVMFSKKSKEEIDGAKKQCRELIDSFLEGTAPGFSDPSNILENRFSPFDPSSINNEVLAKCSGSIRMNKGQILNEVIREVEIEAVGHDGMAGDNIEKGGGHYRQVQRVGTFLKGYRIAESRRIARETASFLLNTVAGEGAQGLDFAFATMNRGDGDGELNDDLIEYLEEAVTSQKRIVMKQMAQINADLKKTNDLSETLTEDNSRSDINVDDFDIETIDMNDPATRERLMQISSEESLQGNQERELMPSEKLLLLLHSLLERVKAEAAFRADEHGKNLRLMALCLNAKNDVQRFQVIQREIGSSLNRADEFAEFLDNAIKYTEKSSTEVTPGTKKLDVNKLRKIQREVADIQSIQAMNASGLKSSSNKWAGNDDNAFQ